jgi:cardiolipin synthase
MYLDDLGHATEITLTERARLVKTAETSRRHGARRPGSAGRAAAGVVSIGSAVGAAMTGHRVLGPAEARIMGTAGLTLLVLAVLALIWPRVIAVPLAVIALWVAVNLLVRARALRRARTSQPEPQPSAGRVRGRRRRRGERSA